MADSLAFLSRPAPITWLTIRQFLGGKAVRVVTLLAFSPCAFALIYLLNKDVATPREFLIDTIFRGLMAPTVIPIAVLILATGALGNEVEDRTLPYLVLKPVSRLRIVLEKLIGILVVALPTVLLGLTATWLIVRIGAGDDPVFVSRRAGGELTLPPVLWSMLGAATAGVIATAAIFLLISLVIPRALLVGIIYAFAWESLLGRYLPGVKIISIRHYVDSIFVDLLNARDATLKGGYSVTASVITLGIAVAVAIALATWRLRRINLE